jgi:uncharacterized protein YutE (UPF0331/DUF86 family)
MKTDKDRSRIISRKLTIIEGYMGQMRQKRDPGIALFSRDRDLQSIILFNLLQAIQACIDIGAHIISESGWKAPATQADIFETLAGEKVITKSLANRMNQMAGFRNRIVNEYEKTDLKTVYAIWKKHLADIEKFCKTVALKYHPK